MKRLARLVLLAALAACSKSGSPDRPKFGAEGNYAYPVGPAAVDVCGTYASNLTVCGIQRTPVSDAGPTAGQVLTFDGGVWGPASPAAATEDYWADFGDGSDGTCSFNGTASVAGFTGPTGGGCPGGSPCSYTQTRAAYCASATLAANVTIVQGLALAYLHVRDTFAWNGTITANGANASTGTGGTNTSTYLGGNGGNGGSNTNGSNGQTLGGGHAVGGGGGAGGTLPATAGTAGTDGGAIFNGVRTAAPWLIGVGISTTISGSSAIALVLFGGLGGGGGAGSATSGGTWTGGGGGAGAQNSVVMARLITGSGTQEANGGNGAAATNSGGGTGLAGGGGGGGGGTDLIVTSSASVSITQTAAAGTGGAGISGGSTGSPGSAGTTIVIGPS